MSNGMVFNGYDFSRVLRVNPTRPIMPGMDVETDDVPGMDGVAFREARLQELSIPVEARLRPCLTRDVAELRHELAAALCVREPAPLILPDDPSRYHLALLSGTTELDRLWVTGKTTLTFVAPDPVAYGAKHVQDVSGTSTVRAGGTYPARFKLTAHPTGDYFQVRDVTSGEFVRVEMTFDSDGGSTLVVDMAARHCEVNGASADKYVTLASDYFALEPSGTELSVSSASTLEWTDRWL